MVLIPGRMAAVTQAQLNLDAPGRIRALAAAGASPTEIVGGLVDDDFDPSADLRQHAVVDLAGSTAAHTGAGNGPAALDRQQIGVSVQGNILVSDAVVDSALDAYVVERAAGSGLGPSLVAGLGAGGEAGG